MASPPTSAGAPPEFLAGEACRRCRGPLVNEPHVHAVRCPIKNNCPRSPGHLMKSPIYSLRFFGVIYEGLNKGKILNGHILSQGWGLSVLEDYRRLARERLSLMEVNGYITLSVRDGAVGGPDTDIVVETFGFAPPDLIGQLAQ